MAMDVYLSLALKESFIISESFRNGGKNKNSNFEVRRQRVIYITVYVFLKGLNIAPLANVNSTISSNFLLPLVQAVGPRLVDHLAVHLFAIAVAVAVVGVAALPRVAEPGVEVTVVEGAADGGSLVAVVGDGWPVMFQG